MFPAPIPLLPTGSAWGGTRVEAWAPASVKDSCKDVVPGPPAIPGPQQYSALYNGMIAPLTRYVVPTLCQFPPPTPRCHPHNPLRCV